MSVADRIADEAQRFLATEMADYEVRLRNASNYSFFYLTVYYQGREIRQDSFFQPFQYLKARRWIRRVVHGHRALVAVATAEGVRYQEGAS